MFFLTDVYTNSALLNKQTGLEATGGSALGSLEVSENLQSTKCRFILITQLHYLLSIFLSIFFIYRTFCKTVTLCGSDDTHQQRAILDFSQRLCDCQELSASKQCLTPLTSYSLYLNTVLHSGICCSLQ